MAAGKLSALKVKALTAPGRYGDGAGLWLQVRDAEHRSWLLRYAVGGKARQMGLGPFPQVSLAEAREAAQRARANVRKGIDPIDARRRAVVETRTALGGLTFRQVADKYLAAHEAGWRNEKHRWQWGQTLDVACETIGTIKIKAIQTADVMRVLEPIWKKTPETASRLRGRIESVIDYATAHGWRTGENPARWRGHLAKLLPAPGKLARVKHHAALPWEEVGAFMAELRDQEGSAARALEFAILTAARTGEVIGARWAEIDLNAAIWVVPGERMKGGVEHRVPLSEPALAILRPMQSFGTADGLVFQGSNKHGGLSNMAMLMLLRRMKRGELTVHGFRSTFRDWCAETTNYPREVAEQALAHVLTDKVEAAYRRGDLFEKRRRLMADWASFSARQGMTSEV
ncbi:MAG TPA: integrase arm-type DNA-binding domain-containing protein, partial [Acetobacteraceae bacterium]